MTESRSEMPVAARLSLVVLGFLIVCGLVGWWVVGFLRTGPATVTPRVVSTSAGPQVYLHMQTMGTYGSGPRPSWVSYMVQDAQGHWVHSTIVQLPAHATVHVTVDQYDSAGLLRNPEWAQVKGTISGSANYTGVVGSKTYSSPTALSLVGASAAAHTFAVPALGINVPLAGIPSNAKNVCNAAPCTTSSTHDTITFTFKTGAPHVYHWQCFIPCGLGFVNGNGGPMQTVGYMMGFLKVV